MNKLIALTLVAGLVLGLSATPAQAAQPLRHTVQQSESKRAPQPARPSPNKPGKPAPSSRPSAPQPSHKPAPSRPGPSHSHNKSGSSTAAKIGMGVVLGAIIGTAIVHATR